MFGATPRWRDQLDARTVTLAAAIALLTFVLQLALLAGTVASPLGGMIADLERIPQIDAGPPIRPDGRLRMTWDDLPLTERIEAPDRVCLVYR